LTAGEEEDPDRWVLPISGDKQRKRKRKKGKERMRD
jgi:hypothetical protein